MFTRFIEHRHITTEVRTRIHEKPQIWNKIEKNIELLIRKKSRAVYTEK
jgi:hypothetical protein